VGKDGAVHEDEDWCWSEARLASCVNSANPARAEAIEPLCEESGFGENRQQNHQGPTIHPHRLRLAQTSMSSFFDSRPYKRRPPAKPAKFSGVFRLLDAGSGCGHDPDRE